MTTEKLNQKIQEGYEKGTVNIHEISNGDYTFREMYQHQTMLFILSCKLLLKVNPNAKVWRTLTRHDYLQDVGWFYMGISISEEEHIIYHAKTDYWELCSFAETIRKSPQFKGNVGNDALNSLNKIINSI